MKLSRSSTWVSSWSVTTTVCAGAVAVARFSNAIAYGIGVPGATKRSGPLPPDPALSLGSSEILIG
jgi:hypothetical protein